MSLNKRTYVSERTVITAQNLNDIQDSIITNEKSISQNATNISNLGKTVANDEETISEHTEELASHTDELSAHSDKIEGIELVQGTLYRDAQGYLCEA